MIAAERAGVGADPGRVYRGLLVDFGGVLTSDVFASFTAFCRAEGLAPETVRKRFLGDPDARGLLEGLELGALTEAQFQPRFAELLGVKSDGLIGRLFGGMEPDEAMLAAVESARAAGVRTGLISNSWGEARYDRGQFSTLFDGVVISGEVGLRKPDPRIYALGAEAIELAPEDCVFVDDLPGNLKPARALGMGTVHHRDAACTVAALEALLGVELRAR